MHGLRCKLVVWLSPLLLIACTTPSTPGIKVEYVDKPVLVETKCVKPKDIPSRPGPLAASAIPSNVESALSVALAKVSEWTRYGNRTDAILKSCVS